MGTHSHSNILIIIALNDQILVSTIQFTKSGPIYPSKCAVNAGSVIALMFGIRASSTLHVYIGSYLIAH